MIDVNRIHDIRPEDVRVRTGLPRLREDVGDISELAASIRDKGQIHPILLTDNNELISGGRRLLACIELGQPVKAIYRSEVSDLELRELELEENLMRKDLEWHERVAMIKEIDSLKKGIHGEGGPGKDYGWSKQSTADLLNISRPAVSQAISLADALEKFPELRKANTEADARKLIKKMEEDIILTILAERANEIVSQSSTEIGEWFIIKDALQAIREVPTESCNYADVDTPYGIDLTKNKKSDVPNGLKTVERYTEWEAKQYILNCEIVAEQMYRILKQDSFMTFWFGIQWYETVCRILEDNGFSIDPVPGVWYSGDAGSQTNIPSMYLGKSYDTFIQAAKGKPAIIKQGRSNVFFFPKVPGDKKIHPTEKPLPLMEEIVKTYTTPGIKGIVPFLGSGNTLRALIRNGSTGFGFEIDAQLKLKFMMRIEEDQKNG